MRGGLDISLLISVIHESVQLLCWLIVRQSYNCCYCYCYYCC